MQLETMLRICALFAIWTGSCVLGQSSNSSSICVHLESCGKCIQFDPRCVWCRDEDYKIDPLAPRCDLITNLQKRCADKDIVNPVFDPKFPGNEELSKPRGNTGRVIQIKPQEVKLKLRPGLPFEFNMAYREAPDYPVDLYYLMDLSKSMEDDKENLAKLGDQLATEMSKITKNFTLGFGSFVDKVVMPYVSTVPEKMKHPCRDCAAPYGFQHHMTLSQNTEKFKDEVYKAQVSGNLDAPEGGFDAIMQSVMCDREIGWRDLSRKLIVFSTDSGFHYAGDGKLGGIVKPNDGHCHLDATGRYSESTNMDYPSLSQLNQKIKEKKMTLIFAVTTNQVSVYEQLSENLEGASARELANDSSNIVKLIKDQYQAITSVVTLKDNADDRYVRVSYFSKCLKGEKLENTHTCKGLKVGETVNFTIMIEVIRCPNETKDWMQTFTIEPVGLKEKLTVNLEIVCECDCEREGREFLSPKCNSSGTYQCGTCDCPPDRQGRFCQCDKLTTSHDLDPQCIQPNANTTYTCSNRGICSCGQCHCLTNKKGWENIYGPYCECSDYSCDRHNKKMCNGDKGKCKCNKCTCIPGWTGSACQCPAGEDVCKAPGKDIVCNNAGDCVCGKCECYKEKNGTRYIGVFCDECPTCEGKCSFYRPCVQCKMFNSGEYDKEQCDAKCNIIPEEVDKAEVEKPSEQVCVFKDVDDCKFTFVYGYDASNNPYIRVQRTKDCPTPVDILMIVLGVIGGIVAIGLCLLLIWKLLTTIHDRREFAEFQKQQQLAKWDTGENPIYKQATSTFSNPTYGRK
uniref:Integrin beta n=1 Tax=Strigamia maritima TaxID=126957 RepID=T1JH92_STRMM